ncbi:MAG: hypothetical protein JWM74_3861 [Myxococcaceae bacterium]|jgi:hypothetical protein|nr:hypothetical protein [Myxococcaceae bacterium]
MMNRSTRTLLPLVVLLGAGLWACSSTGPTFIPPGGDEGDPAAAPSGSATDQGNGADPGTTGSDGGAAAVPGKDASSEAAAFGADGAAAVGTDAGACINAVASPGSGKHHPGEHCMGCHNNQGPAFTIAGTLFTGLATTTPVSGATIEVTDANGKVIKLATYSNGNFYTTTAVTFPLKVHATQCPANLPMVGSVAQGSCNTSGCHATGMRIHL